MKKILVFNSTFARDTVPQHETFVAKLNEFAAGNYEAKLITYKDIFIYLETNHAEVIVGDSGDNFLDFDLVYFKQMRRCTEYASALSTILEAHDRPFMCQETKSILSESKTSEYAKLALSGLPIPRTCLVQSSGVTPFIDTIIAKLGFPMIVKAADGRKGEQNYLIHDKPALLAALATSPDTDFVFQEYIENAGDYRYLVFGESVACILYRTRQKDAETHLNNTSQGADAQLIEVGVDQVSEDLALKAAKIMGREVAGVDIMINQQTGEPVLLEVNNSPQIASGSFTEEKVLAFNKFMLEKLK